MGGNNILSWQEPHKNGEVHIITTTRLEKKKKKNKSQTNAKLNTKNDEGAKLIEMLSNKNSLWLYLYYLQTMLYCQYPFAAMHV